MEETLCDYFHFKLTSDKSIHIKYSYKLMFCKPTQNVHFIFCDPTTVQEHNSIE